jgi:Predicted ring-cleavage extradiol dioxygenase
MSNATQPPTTTDTVIGVAPPGFRMPATLQLGQVSLQVSDLARSLEYYQRVLGLRVLRQSDEDATLAAYGDDAPLVHLRERRGIRPASRQGLLGLYHFAILLPDRAALGRFITHLAELGERAGASDHFVSEALYLRDPDGLGIEVYADRPRSSWRAQGGELVMATEPLDLAAVVAAAQGEPWTGMPAGTRMGHVHLHVADLDEASRFYHEALGLDRMVWSYPGALFLAAGGYHHHLGLNTWAGSGARPAGEQDARLLEWRISLPTAQAARARASLAATGRPVMPTEDGWRTTDPWGTALVVTGDLSD